MEIFILSSGRARKQTTWASLPTSLQAQTTILVPEKEEKTYKDLGLPAIGIPAVGIGVTRKWVIDNAVNHVAMLDDDLVFATRRVDNPTKFKNASVADIEDLFRTIDSTLRHSAHVGVATREGGNRNTAELYHNTRMLRILCYNASRLRELGIRFDRLPVMEDFDVTLQLLRAGYGNVVLNHMVQNQNGSNLAGGCSQYRTPVMQALAAGLLKEYHPDFVKIVLKYTKSAWGGGQRIDVVIQWKRAYDSR